VQVPATAKKMTGALANLQITSYLEINPTKPGKPGNGEFLGTQLLKIEKNLRT
jgi:hypothetical protein